MLLQAKYIKRCPHPNCRHLLIRPETKAIGHKIKMVAVNYLPKIELGRRRRRIFDTGFAATQAPDDTERSSKEGRRKKAVLKEEDEDLADDMVAGEVVSEVWFIRY